MWCALREVVCGSPPIRSSTLLLTKRLQFPLPFHPMMRNFSSHIGTSLHRGLGGRHVSIERHMRSQLCWDAYHKTRRRMFSTLPPSTGSEMIKLLDKDHDGTISYMEVKNYMKNTKNAEREHYKNIEISLPLPAKVADTLFEEGGMSLSVNGIRYKLSAEPDKPTGLVLLRLQQRLLELHLKFRPLVERKAPLDAAAKRRAGWLLWGGAGWMMAQASIVFHFTFFTRFGWDVMEPITYFITFSGIFGGLVFFQVVDSDFTYPALKHVLTQRRARVLYNRSGFDFREFTALEKDIRKCEGAIRAISLPGIGAAAPLITYKTVEDLLPDYEERLQEIASVLARLEREQQQQQQLLEEGQ